MRHLRASCGCSGGAARPSLVRSGHSELLCLTAAADPKRKWFDFNSGHSLPLFRGIARPAPRLSDKLYLQTGPRFLGRDKGVEWTTRAPDVPLAAPSILRHHGVVKPIVSQALVALNSRVAKRRIFIATKGEDGLVHLLGVEHLEADEQMKILHRQSGDRQETSPVRAW